jgi:hypothetical protein
MYKTTNKYIWKIKRTRLGTLVIDLGLDLA